MFFSRTTIREPPYVRFNFAQYSSSDIPLHSHPPRVRFTPESVASENRNQTIFKCLSVYNAAEQRNNNKLVYWVLRSRTVESHATRSLFVWK